MGKFADRYKTNRKVEEEGQWVDFGDGIEVKLRRLNSDHSKETRRKLEKPYQSMYRNRDMPDALQEELMIKQLSQSIVVDWKGVPDPADDEKMIPCTQENVAKVMTQVRDFRDDVVQASMTAATFQDADREVVEGNSGNALNGS
jgi:hypothetical protein